MSEWNLAIYYVSWAAGVSAFFVSAAWALRKWSDTETQRIKSHYEENAKIQLAAQETRRAQLTAFNKLVDTYGSKVPLEDLKRYAVEMGLVDLVEADEESEDQEDAD